MKWNIPVTWLFVVGVFERWVCTKYSSEPKLSRAVIEVVVYKKSMCIEGGEDCVEVELVI